MSSPQLRELNDARCPLQGGPQPSKIPNGDRNI
jgi:hypothetical protein